MLWVPLFKNSENAEETTRNVAAACLGKLATTHPSRYLPQLHVHSSCPNIDSYIHLNFQARIRDDNASARATVISAIRYTFADTSQTYDNLLAPLIVDFLALIQDDDLVSMHLILISYWSFDFYLDCSSPGTFCYELCRTYKTTPYT